MDGVFGHKNFRNEIVWSYAASPSSTKKDFPRKHDIIFRYVKSKHWTFNHQDVRIPYAESSLERIQYPANASTVMEGTEIELNPDGKIPTSTWTDIQQSYRYRNDHMGYPTQKPLKLLERIIKASSNEEDVVLDPFCGCGTTLDAAQEFKRNWIGIDIAIHAIKRVSAVRLKEKWGLQQGKDYELTGVPRNLEGAEELWQRDKYQFQKWAVEMVDGFVTAKKTADGGVDGRLYFDVDNELKAMKLEVKGGSTVQIESLRALAGIIDENDYPMGGFITRKKLGKIQSQNFDDFCRTKGTVEINGNVYQRLQFMSVAEILEGKTFDTPLIRGKSSSLQMTLLAENRETTSQ